MSFDRPLYEGRPEYIPSPEDMAKIHRLFQWVDSMHGFVRRPQGMAWVEMQAMMFGLHELVEWVDSGPKINGRYRFRIDAPMDPEAQVPDHLPKEWEV